MKGDEYTHRKEGEEGREKISHERTREAEESGEGR